ncbi:MAG: hypothetical protein GAK45_00937 [Pseudomonas citronellolis]|nr:MAG: hypothetical protein GAK45_00937 [Pseudomonas citronellolis]
MDARKDERSLAQLLGVALLEMLWIGVLVAVAACLPWHLALPGWLALAAAQPLMDRWRGKVPLRLQQALFFCTLGIALGVAQAIGHFWLGLAAGAALALAGILAQIRLEKRFGLRLERSALQAVEPEPPRGTSAWSGDGPLLSPEGEPVRCLMQSEIAMGGPLVCDYLLPDGCLVEGASPSARFSSDGRYFVSPMPSRGAWRLLVLDRQERLLYHCAVDNFWELDSVTATQVIGRHSPLTDDGAHRHELAALLAHTEAIPLRAVADLWIAADLSLPALNPLPLAAAPQRAALHPWLPASLRELDDPLAPLRYPQAELWLDGQPCEVFLPLNDPPVVSLGAAFACQGRAGLGGAHGYWLWQPDAGLLRLGEPWQALADEPSCSAGSLLALEAEGLCLGLEIGILTLSYDDHGTLSSFSYGAQRLSVAHAADGTPRHAYIEPASLQLLLPLDGRGGRAHCRLRSAPLANGECLSWRWLRDSADGRLGIYACQLGEAALPGEWLLDHRQAEDGQHIALLRLGDDGLPRLCWVDLRGQCLVYPPALARPALQGFVDEQVALLCLLGRIDYQPPSGPGGGDPGRLRRFDEALPSAESWAAFLADRDDSRLYYERQWLRCDGAAWSLRETRRTSQPTSAHADGDCLLASPTGDDQAWAFGFDSRYLYQDEAGEQHAACDGYLLTASGCGVTGLAAPMIWSADGRYLALTRLDAQERWQLLLLDVQAHSLRRFDGDLGWWPRFEAFDARNLQIECGGIGGDRPLAHRQRHVLALQGLLEAPAQALHDIGGCWLTPDELDRRHYWKRLVLPSSVAATM